MTHFVDPSRSSLSPPVGMKSVLLVSPYFPPSTLAGVHRARHLARHLPAAGWWPVVLCVDERHHAERLDPELMRLLPDTIEVVKSRALPHALLRPVGVGDLGLRALTSLRSEAERLLSTRPFDAVMITGGPYYPMLLAAPIKRRFGIPVVLDFQDPWVSQWGMAQPRLSKAGLSHSIATLLEPKVVRAADFITSVSEVQNAQMRQRYGFLAAERMAAIPIGGDAADFDALRRAPLTEPAVAVDRNRITLSYVGACLPRAIPLMEVVLRALVRLQAQAPSLAEKVRLEFVGTSNQPGEGGSRFVQPIAERLGVAHLVRETPQRIPYLDALHVLANSHALLLVGSDEPHYTASKIYPALSSGRPYLSLFHEMSSAHAILSRAGGGVALSFGADRPVETLIEPATDALFQLATSPDRFAPPDELVIGEYSAAAIARSFAAIFDRLAVRRAA